MSGTGPRESLFPTRMALTNTKTRLKGAQTGHSLLAKKRDALTNRFRAILRKVDEVRPFVHSVSPQTSLHLSDASGVGCKIRGCRRVGLVDVCQLVG